jgi:molybdenum-dependent DNA-binding transcriptional regulator ModE
MKENTMDISKARYDSLNECSSMLGRIAVEVLDWCREDGSTTLEAVLAMKAELYRLRAEVAERALRAEEDRRAVE